MRRFLSLLLMLVMVLSIHVGETAFAATTNKLSKRETSIAKAYVKAYQSGKLSYIEDYIYPGVKFKVDKVKSGTKIKMISPKYEKKYDSKTKMNYIMISGITIVSTKNDLSIFRTTMGINIKSEKNVEYIYSKNKKAESSYKKTAGDVTNNDLSKIRTYLVDLYGEDYTSKFLPDDSPDKNTIPLGNTHTWDGGYIYGYETVRGTFSIKLNSVKAISYEKAKGMGYNGIANEYLEYELINLTIEGENLRKFPGNEPGYRLIDSIFEGSETDGDNIGYIKFMDNCDVNKAFNPANISESNTKITLNGDLIIPIVKGENPRMVFLVTDAQGKLRKMYFKIN